MATIELATLAAVSMVVTDVLASAMVMAEAGRRGVIAGLLDTLGWLASITTTSISVTTLSGQGPFGDKAIVVVFVSLANFFGTWLGVGFGAKLLKTELRAGFILAAITRRLSKDNGLRP